MMHSFTRGLALAVLLPTIAAGQQIRGVVVEDSTFLPISDAKIELLTAEAAVRATSISAVTGWFELSPPGGGQFLVRASHPAYTGIAVFAVTFDRPEIITVVLRLSGGPIPIEPLVVRGTARDLSGFRGRASRAAFGRFITRADIDKYGGYNLSHVMRFTPEVRIERVRDGPFMSDGVFMRSFGDLCVPAVYLDGVAVPTGRVFDINDLLSVEEVEGIEIYRSTLSAPMEFRLPAFGADETCGVIAVWSRQTSRAPLTLKRVFFAGSLVGASLLLTRLFQ